ncbi:MAG: A/G-specific adenine glycosylase [Terracidiphilus sp.]|nr:A/G-specific adenine glycosylase [Terracidiphilus sp.]
MNETNRSSKQISQLRQRLLEWYEQNRRELPWRQSHDPYAIWVSEIMLQQTRVAVVIERYNAFLTRFPTLVALALGREDEVLALWSGLGYYRRARMLHKAAQFVAGTHHGNLPTTAAELRKLPGIGDYTAAAIASIAHNEPVAVVDGNVERVMCRMEGWDAVERSRRVALRRRVEELAKKELDRKRPGDFNQAMMELGAMVCTPRNPQCLTCPIAFGCATQGEHKTPARPKMLSRQVGFALSVRTSPTPQKTRKKTAGHSEREVLLEKRPATETVMPGMWELPTLKETEFPESDLRMTLRHAIMQVNYYVCIRTVFEDDVPALTVEGQEQRWVPLDEAGQMALTGLARKVLTRARLLPTPPMDRIIGSGADDPLQDRAPDKRRI